MSDRRVHSWIVPALVSALVLGYLVYTKQISVGALLLLSVLGVAWAVWLVTFLKGAGSQSAPRPTASATEELRLCAHTPFNVDPVERYYVSLTRSIEACVVALHGQIKSTEALLTAIDVRLAEASLLANETGLLAQNSVSAAARAGEVGRGFVSVSGDVARISEQLNKDLIAIRALVSDAKGSYTDLKTIDLASQGYWFESDTAVQRRNLGCVASEISAITAYRNSLMDILERYLDDPHRDIRWLQLSDSLTRVIEELLNVFSDVLDALNHVAKDLRLVAVADSLSERQRRNIKETLRLKNAG